MSLRELLAPDPNRKMHKAVHGGQPGDPCPHCGTLLSWDQVQACPDGNKTCLTQHFGWVCFQCHAQFADTRFDLGPMPARAGITVLGPDDPKREPLGIILEEKLGIGASNR